jgi:hypothetical protein
MSRMVRRRGNPDWGKPMSPAPAVPSEFEMFVKRLRLTPENYASSVALKDWCKLNRNRCYIPEWLLEEWGITVDGQDIA